MVRQETCATLGSSTPAGTSAAPSANPPANLAASLLASLIATPITHIAATPLYAAAPYPQQGSTTQRFAYDKSRS